MNITEEKLPHSQIVLTITLTDAELRPALERAAQRLSAKSPLAGFRPGKAPYEVSKSRFGEKVLYDEALQDALLTQLSAIVAEKQLPFVGQPQIEVLTYGPGEGLIYKATLALMPEVTLGDWKTVSVEKKEAEVTVEELDKTIQQFAEWQAKEVAVTRAAQLKDRVAINFEVLVDNVVIEGGKAEKYPVILGAGTMIPGMEEQLVGMSAGEKKEFDLTFPDPYYQPHLAGKPAHFKVEMVQVLERSLPELTDEWAQQMSGHSLAEWKKQLETTLKIEKQQEVDRRWEQEVIEKIISLSTFGEMPELLINEEADKMLRELRQSVEQRQLQWTDYLSSMKKSEEQLLQDFRPQAEQRIKAALVLRQLARDNKITVPASEVDQALEIERQQYKGNAEAEKALASHDYRHYLENMLTHRKVLDLLERKN